MIDDWRLEGEDQEPGKVNWSAGTDGGVTVEQLPAGE